MTDICILDNIEYPSKDEWSELYREKKAIFNSLQLKDIEKEFNIFDLDTIQFNYWVDSFNNRVFDLVNNYILTMHVYKKGINDKTWFISPGKAGNSIEYFPNFKENDFVNLYWFGFYLDSYYARYMGLIDTLYHIANVKYKLDVKDNNYFRKNIVKKLIEKNILLGKIFENAYNNGFYQKISSLRNNIMHNVNPHSIDSGVGIIKDKDGRTIGRTFGIGNYTTSDEFVHNINESLEFINKLMDKVKPWLK